MPTPTIPDGELFMNATLYSGTGATQTITNGVAGQSFQPDFVWIKARSTTTNHRLYDSVRGATLQIQSNNTDAEAVNANGLTAFGSNGFTVGSASSENASGQTFVGWQWKAGGAAVTNTAGTISSQVSANTTSGFSVVTYTGSGAAGSVGHGLGATPAMIITKNRTTGGNSWVTWHRSLPSATANPTAFIYLDQTAAASTTTNFYNGTAMTSTTFSWFGGNINVNSTSNNYVSYCWTEIAGYSAFGSYTGNGSTDGPFVYTGFRPRFVIIKSSTFAGADWVMYDSARNTYNALTSELSPNSSASENNYSGAARMDFLSNGIKLRTSGAGLNNSGSTYIYMVFAENPFKYANAR